MATMTRTIGPADAGVQMTWDEFSTLDWEEGYRYELIDGRLVVAEIPDIAHAAYTDWLHSALTFYRHSHPDAVNHLSCVSCVFVSGRKAVTVPRPDVAAYRDF